MAKTKTPKRKMPLGRSVSPAASQLSSHHLHGMIISLGLEMELLKGRITRLENLYKYLYPTTAEWMIQKGASMPSAEVTQRSARAKK